MWFVILYLFYGLLFMGISRPMILRRIKPNRLYGFRTRKTLSNPNIWYAANEYSGRKLFCAGVLITLFSLLLAPLNLFGKNGFGLYTGIMAGTIFFSVIGATIASFRYLKRL